MNKVYIVSTGMDILGTSPRRWFEAENILRVFSDEEDAFRCLQVAAAEGFKVPRNWPIGKKVYIYPKTYAVMRAYEVKGEPDEELGRMPDGEPGQNPGQVPVQVPVPEGTDAQ